MPPIDVEVIIEALDKELERTGKTFFTPTEANHVLSGMGLLGDYEREPGQPLRYLLQAGRIPHAYKLGGKRSQWVIPHSSARRRLDKPNTDYSQQT